ncbi:DNA repair DNA-dependent ATPase RecA [Helicosporidium sp. ATCC 50920]|nr:DNA repair DNA-dependent ATPase RecA [Helicosporidium sp. ATCC 50920]|eukprot:KDD76638.1 DNA repair DNA-dependent ATPase RecA [Helicosporidium sp. ATCC 50920]
MAICELCRGTVYGLGRPAPFLTPNPLLPFPNRPFQTAALEHALKEINARFGKNSVMQLGQRDAFGQVRTTPSGALTLDAALGGGYPVGRIVEIYGPESSGKTTLALHAMAEVQRRGGKCVLIDAEHAFDPVFARRAGLDVDALYLSQPDCGEAALEIADNLIRSGGVDMVAVDSVAALVPRAEIEGEIGQLQVGAQARLMSAALRKIAGNAAKHGATVIFLNQLRHKVGVIYGSPEVTSGGQALKYYASCRIEVRIKEKLVATKAGQGAGGGGSWYYFEGTRIEGNGRDKALDALRENSSLAAELEAKTREALLAGERPDDALASTDGEDTEGEGEPEESGAERELVLA